MFARVRVVARSSRRFLLPAGAATVVAFTARAAVVDLQHARAREHEPSRAAYGWLRKNTPPDALVLASPGLEYAGLLMERPTVVSCKAVPTAPSDVAEWYRRLVDVDGGVAPKERGFPAFEEIDNAFEALTARQIDALAAKYHARFLMIRHGHALPYRAMFDEGGWTIYTLTP